MRLDDALDTRHLPLAELAAARLDGDLRRLGDAHVPVDLPDSPTVRGASIAGAAGGLVAGGRTAAWVHGALPDPPWPRTWIVDVRTGRRGLPLLRPPRELRLGPGEVEVLGGLRVTTAVRTAYDLAMGDGFGPEEAALCGALLGVARTDGAAAAAEAAGYAGAPHKHRALARLSALPGLRTAA